MCLDRLPLPSQNIPHPPLASLSSPTRLLHGLFYGKAHYSPRLTPCNLGGSECLSTIQYTFAIQRPKPQHLPRGSVQPVFSQPPRQPTSRLPPYMFRRGARLKTLCIIGGGFSAPLLLTTRLKLLSSSLRTTRIFYRGLGSAAVANIHWLNNRKTGKARTRLGAFLSFRDFGIGDGLL